MDKQSALHYGSIKFFLNHFLMVPLSSVGPSRTGSFKGSVQRDEWGVGHMYVQFLMGWESRDRDWFEFLWRRRLITSIFLFSPTPVKLIGQI